MGAGDRGWGLLATLVGMRVTVALGSRLRGNDGRGGAGTTNFANVSLGAKDRGGDGTAGRIRDLRGNDGGAWFA